MGTDIDSQRQALEIRGVLPECQLAAGSLQHLIAQRQDQAGFLGQRDEVKRGNQAALRVPPAHEHLGSRDLIAGNLRLKMQQKLPGSQSLAQIVFEGGAILNGGFERGVEKPDGISPGILRFVHGKLGLLEQIFCAARLCTKERDADAGRAMMREGTELISPAQCVLHFFSQHLDGTRGICFRFAQAT